MDFSKDPPEPQAEHVSPGCGFFKGFLERVLIRALIRLLYGVARVSLGFFLERVLEGLL